MFTVLNFSAFSNFFFSAIFSNASQSTLVHEQAKMKTLLEEKEEKIAELEKKIELLIKEVKTDDVTTGKGIIVSEL